MLCWDVIWWSFPCLSLPHYYCLHKLISKVVHSTPTHSTQHTHTQYTAHPYTWYIPLAYIYLPPTDYTCRYQRDVLGTGCWKTLECKKEAMIIATTYRKFFVVS